jgi:hypothetical protein
MKLMLAAILTFLIAIQPAASAEEKPEAKSFAAFWVQFKAAVAKGNKEAVADMTKLPFLLDSKPLAKADFIKQCGKLFDRNAQRCFSNAKPVRDPKQDSYSVFCGETIFVFEKVNGEYRFTDLGVND